MPVVDFVAIVDVADTPDVIGPLFVDEELAVVEVALD